MVDWLSKKPSPKLQKPTHLKLKKSLSKDLMLHGCGEAYSVKEEVMLSIGL